MDSKQFHRRLSGVQVILAALVLGFLWILWDLQVVNGAYYRSQSIRKIVYTETVEAARGEILDRYGRVLVTNRTSYQVTLNTSLMGEEEQRNGILLELLAIAQEEGVSWPDTLPISKTAPFTFALDEATTAAKTNFDTLVSRMSGWQAARDEGADALIEKMREFFEVDPSVSDEDARALVGLLYELRLRSSDIVRTSYVFAQDVEIGFISKVKERSLTGVDIKATTVREYNTTYAAHLLGRVGAMSGAEWEIYQSQGYAMDDTVGKDGVEKAFESYLRGEAAVRYYETNEAGKVVSEYWRVDEETGEELVPEPGENVMLTLDIRLQEVLERSLAERVPELDSEDTLGASGVVIDVRDGSVLAMASYPTFDLANLYTDSTLYQQVSTDPLSPLLNRATQGLYSPGSTFKMVTAIGGLEEGIITPDTLILDTGVYRYYDDYQPACWDYRQYGRTHGNQNVTQAILNSCNVFFYDVGRQLGIEGLGEYAAAFGLGEKTGLEIYEEAGAMDSPEYTASLGQTWYGGLTLSVAIGQGNSQFTPIQLANYIATMVNGGDLYSTHLLKTVKSSDYSQVVYEYEPQLRGSLDLGEENLEAVKEGMRQVGEKYFSNLGVEVGAKTGSAQVAADLQTHAIFVCFAPYDDPQIAIALVVERGGSGSGLAPIAGDVMEYYFHAESTLEAVDGENELLR